MPGARSVFGIDVDGDSDLDVLSASQSLGLIHWHENPGFGTVSDYSRERWTAHLVSNVTDDPHCVFGIDLDSDGDIDVLSASSDDNVILWHENLNGAGDIWSTHVINTHAYHTRSVFGVDIDGDGDIDVLSATERESVIAWYENVDGRGHRWIHHTITVHADYAIGVVAADMDGDDDVDVISCSANIRSDITSPALAWYASKHEPVR